MESKKQHITTTPPTAEQLEHRHLLKKHKERKRQKALDDALRYKVGTILLECLPCVATLKVCRTKAENETEFAPLRELLLRIANSKDYSMLRNEIAIDTESST